VHAPGANGLLLGVTNADGRQLAADCRKLAALVREGGG
jgi:YD repeat-containing protein